MRLTSKVEEHKVSTEERLKIVEGQLGSVQDELSKIRQMLSKLVEKGAEGSPSDPLTRGDILDVVMVKASLVGPPSAQCKDDQGSGVNGEGESEARGEGEDEDDEESD